MKRGTTMATAHELERAAATFDGFFADPAHFPTRYTYDGVVYDGFGEGFACSLEKGEDERCRTAVLTAENAAWGLTFTVKGRVFKQYAVYEWTIYCKNTGTADSKTLKDWNAAYRRYAPNRPTLYHNIGDDPYFPELYKPLATRLAPGMMLSFSPMGGRGSSFAFPYYDLQYGADGTICVVGWPGTWTADFLCDQRQVIFAARQTLLDAYLHPGEEIRSPRMLFLEYDGCDRFRVTNLWRRWYLDCCMRKRKGEDYGPKLSLCFGPLELVDEQAVRDGIESAETLGLKPDICWIDAGWYRKNPSGESIGRKGGEWNQTGELVADAHKYPNGLGAAAKIAHDKGMDFLLWFETDRILKGNGSFMEGKTEWTFTADTSKAPGQNMGIDGLWRSEGDWQDCNFLADMTNEEYRRWLVETVDKIIVETDMDIYRQDYNIEPGLYIAQNSEEGRAGILENHYQCGYLAYWDELLRRHPDMLINACSSGGRRLDLESIYRGFPTNATDYFGSDYQGKPALYQALFAWFPYFSSGLWEGARPVGDEALNYATETAFVPILGLGYDSVLGDIGIGAPQVERIRLWEKTKPYYFGDYYPLVEWSRDDGHWSGWQFITDDGCGYLQAFRRNGAPEMLTVRLHGLDADTTYRLTDKEGNTLTRTGAELANGFDLVCPTSPACVLWFFEPEK